MCTVKRCTHLVVMSQQLSLKTDVQLKQGHFSQILFQPIDHFSPSRS